MGGMTEFQLIAVVLCFWPVVAIGMPFSIFLREERLLRFSLRTLLTAMTLVAVVLGLAVWVAK
jgi:hypothetical protein